MNWSTNGRQCARADFATVVLIVALLVANSASLFYVSRRIRSLHGVAAYFRGKGVRETFSPAVRNSREDAVDDLPMHIGETAVDAVVVKGELLVIDAEQVQDRGVKVGNGDFVFGDEISDLV